MKIKELVNQATKELEEEKKEIAVSEIKQRLIEIQSARVVLNKLEKQYNEFLEKDIDDTLFLE